MLELLDDVGLAKLKATQIPLHCAMDVLFHQSKFFDSKLLLEFTSDIVNHFSVSNTIGIINVDAKNNDLLLLIDSDKETHVHHAPHKSKLLQSSNEVFPLGSNGLNELIQHLPQC